MSTETLSLTNENVEKVLNELPNRKKLEALLIALPSGLVSFPGVVISSPGFFMD